MNKNLVNQLSENFDGYQLPEPPATPKEMKLRQRSDELLAAAKRAEILTDEHAEKGTDLAKYIRTALSMLEDERKGIVKPFNDVVKAINSRVKLFTSRLEEAKQIIDKKMIRFKLDKEEQARKQAEEARKAAEVNEPTKDTTDLGYPGYISPPAAPTRGNIGTASIVTRYDFKVINIKAVRSDLLCVDAVAVRKLINGASRVSVLDGIEIFEVKDLTVR